MSISISPAITTTPALDTVYPIYWEEGKSYPPILLLTDDLLPDTLTVTITPTQDWYAFDGGRFGGVGESVTFSVEKDDDDMPFRVAVASELTEEPEKFISFGVRIGQSQ